MLQRIMLVAFVLFYSNTAFAYRVIPDCKKHLIENDVVFLGRAIANGTTSANMQSEYKQKKMSEAKIAKELPNSYTDFEIIDLYKGVPQKTVRVFYVTYAERPIRTSGDESSIPSFSINAQETIFARLNNDFLLTSNGRNTKCNNPEGLKEIKAQYDAIESLILQSSQTPEFYLKKIALLEDNKDYAGAIASFERLFSANAEAKQNHEWLAHYGRDLQLSGNLEKALKVLSAVQDVPSATADTQLSLIHLGRANELNGQKLLLSGQEISNVTIADADFSNSDFSGAKLTNVKFSNVKFVGANFSKTQLQIDSSKSDFTSANFSESKIRGTLLDNNFDKADFRNSELNLNETSRNSFKEANFSDSKLFIMEGRAEVAGWEGSDFSGARFIRSTIGGIGKSIITGADFTGASFYTKRGGVSRDMALDLSNQQLDDSKFDSSDFSDGSFKGASLKDASFTGSNLTNVDFSQANLSGADFTVSHYTGATKLHGANLSTAIIDGAKWEGAIYDCKTKFPANFDLLAFKLEAGDPTCAQKPPADLAIFSKDRFSKGNINVCGGDYHAACIYGFIVQETINKDPSNYYERRAEFLGVARSFLDAGSPDLARMMLYRTYAEHYEVYGTTRPIGSEFFNMFKEAGGVVPTNSVNLSDERFKVPVRERKSPLREEALDYLDQHNTDKALEAALKGLKQVAGYPSPNPQKYELLLYADIIARIEGGIKNDAAKIMENMIRTLPYTHAHSNPANQPSDYVAEGEKLLSAH